MLKILLGSSRPINLDYLGLRAELSTLILVIQRECLLANSRPGLSSKFASIWGEQVGLSGKNSSPSQKYDLVVFALNVR